MGTRAAHYFGCAGRHTRPLLRRPALPQCACRLSQGRWRVESVPTRLSRPEVLEFGDCAVPLSNELEDNFRRARNIGQVRTTNPERFDFYGDVGQQKITGTEPIPTIGKPSQDFAGFLNGPVYRPLVANSKPYFSDPEQWNPAHMSSEVVELLREQFRQKFPKVSNCANPEDGVEKPWPYKDENVKVTTVYSSITNWSVARLQLGEYRCDGPADDPFVDQWFSISPTREVKFLGKAMWLVDAGDYDSDGQSELVFSIDDYNRGGYKLFTIISIRKPSSSSATTESFSSNNVDRHNRTAHRLNGYTRRTISSRWQNKGRKAAENGLKI